MREAPIEAGPYSLRLVSAQDTWLNTAADCRANLYNSEKKNFLSELLEIYL